MTILPKYLFRHFRPATFRVALLLLIQPLNVLSQQNRDTLKTRAPVASYFEKMDTVISLRLNINNEHERFVLIGDNFKYDIRPNIYFSNRLSVNYRFISLGVGFTLRFLPGNNGNELQGKTKAFYLRLNINTKYWLQELQFGRAVGFYLYNTGDYVSGWIKGTDPYIQFPGLRVIAVRGTTSYKFNPRFSVKALNSQTEIQRKSCGSLIPFLSYAYFFIDNNPGDTTQQSTQHSNNYEAVINLGYYYTFVIGRRFYISMGAAPGCGAGFTHLVTVFPGEKVYTDYFSPVFRLQERAGIGYNSRKFFAGAEITLVQSTRNNHGTAVQMNTNRSYLQVFFGYRFTAPRFVKKNTLLLEEKLPVNIIR